MFSLMVLTIEPLADLPEGGGGGWAAAWTPKHWPFQGTSASPTEEKLSGGHSPEDFSPNHTRIQHRQLPRFPDHVVIPLIDISLLQRVATLLCL